MNPITGELTPASTQICFNASITNDDALLVNSISRREDLTFTQARTVLAETTRDLQGALATDRELCFPRIGTLSLSEDNVMSFRPFPSLVSTGSIMPPALQKVETIKDNEAPVRKKSDDFYTIRVSRKLVRGTMRYAAMLVLIIISCVTLSDPGTSGRHSYRAAHTDHASVIPLPNRPVASDSIPAAPAEDSLR